MTITKLVQAVEGFVQATRNYSEAQLEIPWAWGAYDSEGIRFAFFRTYEQLREMGIHLNQERSTSSMKMTVAQSILAQYHGAYRDLDAALLNLSGDEAELDPGDAQWPVRKVLAHIVEGDFGFMTLVQVALDAFRANLEPPKTITDEDFWGIIGMGEAEFGAIMQGPLPGLVDFHAASHQRHLDQLAQISDEELALPSYYWEGYPLPLEFRLHRFESHMRQHTLQVEKTRERIGRPLNETLRLARLLYSALAEVEATTIGGWEPVSSQVTSVADEINQRAQQVIEAVG